MGIQIYATNKVTPQTIIKYDHNTVVLGVPNQISNIKSFLKKILPVQNVYYIHDNKAIYTNKIVQLYLAKNIATFVEHRFNGTLCK